MSVPGTARLPSRWVEHLLAVIILGGILYSGIHLLRYGFLPPPFFYEPSDTFADWFNPAFWSRREGAYDAWKTVYLPLSFVFLRYLGIDRCYPASRALESSAGLVARDCDWLGLVMMAVIFAANIYLTWRTFRKLAPETALPRTICVAMGAPMLNALERGNLILAGFTCLLLAFGPLLASARLRWVFAGLAINFKIYLVASVIPLLLKRRWRWVEGALLATIVIYLLSYAAFGQGTPMEIFTNVRDFSGIGATQILDVWYTATYQPLYSVLETGTFPMSQIIGSVWVDRLMVLIPLLTRFTQVLIMLAALAIWYRPEAFTSSRAIALGTLAAILTSEPGGYTIVCFMLFVLMEPWRGFGRKWAIVACYVMAFPFDFPIDTLPESVTELYFRDSTALVSRHVTLGPFVRPLINMTIAWALALTTLHDLWKEMAENAHLPSRRFRQAGPKA
ncbi:glycosyltransferase family 87 protein [Novosphingobium sp. B 225]|uniref:glycosyltransferase family 87 protein n=1 Tax=Novosphingobium sp. B 225 TaxID=1961849 RepID=UPI001125169C|nr:glycosyltransferase family 87 protein [Novosphingobium sp. B 225]